MVRLHFIVRPGVRYRNQFAISVWWRPRIILWVAKTVKRFGRTTSTNSTSEPFAICRGQRRALGRASQLFTWLKLPACDPPSIAADGKLEAYPTSCPQSWEFQSIRHGCFRTRHFESVAITFDEQPMNIGRQVRKGLLFSTRPFDRHVAVATRFTQTNVK